MQIQKLIPILFCHSFLTPKKKIMQSFTQKINALVSQNAGQQSDLTEIEKFFIELYLKEFESLSEGTKILAFRNAIINNGRCGFASGGAEQYLVNTDSGHRYRVTVRTFWRQGVTQGQFDSTYVTEAGSRTYLGCTDSGAIPVTYYARQVVGEVAV